MGACGFLVRCLSALQHGQRAVELCAHGGCNFIPPSHERAAKDWCRTLHQPNPLQCFMQDMKDMKHCMICKAAES